jgi:hypothetical protein
MKKNIQENELNFEDGLYDYPIVIPDMEIEGWGFPPIPGAKIKAHYFTKNRHALCGKWIWVQNESILEQEDGIRSPDDCKICLKRLEKSKNEAVDYLEEINSKTKEPAIK